MKIQAIVELVEFSHKEIDTVYKNARYRESEPYTGVKFVVRF